MERRAGANSWRCMFGTAAHRSGVDAESYASKIEYQGRDEASPVVPGVERVE